MEYFFFFGMSVFLKQSLDEYSNGYQQAFLEKHLIESDKWKEAKQNKNKKTQTGLPSNNLRKQYYKTRQNVMINANYHGFQKKSPCLLQRIRPVSICNIGVYWQLIYSWSPSMGLTNSFKIECVRWESGLLMVLALLLIYCIYSIYQYCLIFVTFVFY